MTKKELLQAIDNMPMDATIALAIDEIIELTSVDYCPDSNTIELF